VWPQRGLPHVPRPQRGLHDALGPLGRAFLMPRPMGVVDYSSTCYGDVREICRRGLLHVDDRLTCSHSCLPGPLGRQQAALETVSSCGTRTDCLGRSGRCIFWAATVPACSDLGITVVSAGAAHSYEGHHATRQPEIIDHGWSEMKPPSDAWRKKQAQTKNKDFA
jgi:hypothetical protein